MSVQPSVTVAFANSRHMQNQTPIEEVIQEYSEMVVYHTDSAKAYENAIGNIKKNGGL